MIDVQSLLGLIILVLSIFLMVLWLSYRKHIRQLNEQNQQQQQMLEATLNDHIAREQALSIQLAQTQAEVKLLSTTEQELKALQNSEKQYLAEISRLKSQLESNETLYAEKLSLLEEARVVLSKEFKLLSNEIVEQKQKQLTEHSKETMNALIEPMQASLKDFKQKFEKVHEEDIAGRASLVEQLKQLQQLNQQMSSDAQNLTQALKGDQKLQGNWGELILEKLLEKSGLQKGKEFECEKSFQTEDGKRLRPDVIIRLPDEKRIVIDSKVSLTHYEQAISATDEVEKTQAIKQHLLSLQKHIKELAQKKYEQLEGLNAPDFVLMFIPIEGAYLLAVEQSPELFENAFEQRVAVVTPTTLFTTLKTVEQLWRYERQSEHTVKLIRRAADVHDKFVGFVENFEKVGKQLNTASTTYDHAWQQLKEGKGNLIRQAEMLKDLAGKTKKEIPSHLLQEAQGSKLIED